MAGKMKLLACTSLCAVVMLAGSAAFAGTASSGPSNAELQAEIDSLQQELQTTQMNMPKPVEPAKAVSGWWDNTSINGRMYYDLSWIDSKVNGVKQSNSGVGFDIKRFYVGIDHKFNDVFSGNVTTDFQYSSVIGATEVYIKKAYLQAKLSQALTLRFGATDLPWIPFVEGVYGYRYVENTLVDRTHFGTSSDWGVHALGKLANGVIEYDIAVVDGAGYKKPLRSKSMDFEGRVNVNLQDFVLAAGGYVGKLGKDIQGGVSTYHDASRFDALAAYKTKQIRLGFEYFKAWDWNQVTSVASDESEGFGGFASYKFDPEWGVFGRYDYVESSQTLAPNHKDNYFNVGLEWSPAKIVDFSLVYKRDKVEDTGLNAPTDEVGIFSRFRW